MEKRAIREGGVRRLMVKVMKNSHILFVIPSLTSPTSNLRLSCLIDPHLPAIYLNP